MKTKHKAIDIWGGSAGQRCVGDPRHFIQEFHCVICGYGCGEYFCMKRFDSAQLSKSNTSKNWQLPWENIQQKGRSWYLSYYKGVCDGIHFR